MDLILAVLFVPVLLVVLAVLPKRRQPRMRGTSIVPGPNRRGGQ